MPDTPKGPHFLPAREKSDERPGFRPKNTPARMKAITTRKAEAAKTGIRDYLPFLKVMAMIHERTKTRSEAAIKV
jgi:hypothetical protein